MCFAFINMMRQQGPPEHIHKDKQAMADVNFHFM